MPRSGLGAVYGKNDPLKITQRDVRSNVLSTKRLENQEDSSRAFQVILRASIEGRVKAQQGAGGKINAVVSVASTKKLKPNCLQNKRLARERAENGQNRKNPQ